MPYSWATRTFQKNLAPRSLGRPGRLAGVSGALVLSLLACGAHAADWKITPRLGVRETYTDNVSLATAGNEKSEFITQINPGISLSGKGGRVSAQVDYTLQNLIYARDSKNNTANHQLAANGNAELVEQSLFVDARASIRQQNISLLAPLGVENTSTTGNLATVTTYSVSPYWRQTFGTTASTELRYGHDEVHFDNGGLSDSSTNRVNFSLNSGPAFANAFWGLSHADSRIDYQGRPDYDSRVTSGNLGYRLTPKFKVFGKGGYEKFGYQASNQPGSDFWNVGFGWAPTTRTNLEATYGERFFGKTYSLDFSHRTRMTAWNAGYSQTVMTTAQQLAGLGAITTAEFLCFNGGQYFPGGLITLFPDPTKCLQVAQLFVNAMGWPNLVPDAQSLFTNRVFLDKRFLASVSIISGKSVVALSAFNTLRESLESGTISSSLLGSGDFLAGDKIRQYGATAAWGWKMLPHTSSNLSGSWSRVLQPVSGREDDLWNVRLSLVRQFQPKVHGSLEYRHQRRNSNQAAGDYKENAVTAAVNMTF
jgi:uncharacterized protein (PEP-CTERM system associated)